MGGADQAVSRVQQAGNSYMPRNEGIVVSGSSKEAKKMQNYSMNRYDGHERNLAEGGHKIRLLAESLNLNHADVRTLAYEYLKKIEETRVLKGKSLDVKVACVFFAAAR